MRACGGRGRATRAWALVMLVHVARARAWTTAVVGSVNVDVIARVGMIPREGDTVVTRTASTTTAMGGKGANQAIAASRMTCEDGGLDRRGVGFVGRFGADAAGDATREAMAREVDLGYSARSAIGSATGLGFVMVANDGGTSAVVVPGANALDWNDDDAALEDEFRDALRGTETLMLQREIPHRVNVIAAKIGREMGAHTIVLDAGGSHEVVDGDLLALVDYVAPNESELAGMAGVDVDTLSSEEAVIEAARKVAGTFAVKVLCTLGARGSLLVSASGVERGAPSRLPDGAREVDATAAGDAFRAAFAVAMGEGKNETQALRFAGAAGALAVTKLGAMPSLPTRREVDALLGEESRCADRASTSTSSTIEDELAAQHFASRLNSMKSRSDLFLDRNESAPEVFNLVKRMGRARGISHVFFNYPEHFITKTGEEIEPEILRRKVLEQSLRIGAVCVRFPEEPYRLGAFTNPDPAVRRLAEGLVRRSCETAVALDANEVIIWPRYDGYDYYLQADYASAWDDMVQSYKIVASSAECASLKVSVEFKPTDEKSRFSFIPSTGAALLLVDAVGEPNFGLTIDVGHALAAGENPAQSIVMTASRGRLFGVQLGDGHSRLGAEDGLMFGSVHTNAALEIVSALRAHGYAGFLYFDTFPLNEDPVEEASRNVRTFRDFHKKVAASASALADAAARRDALRAADAFA